MQPLLGVLVIMLAAFFGCEKNQPSQMSQIISH